MNITLAKTAGFCFGVNRAVQMVYDLVDSGQKVCTLGPIIHNSQMVEELKSKGVRVVDIASEAFQDEILVIRSHGVGKSVVPLFYRLDKPFSRIKLLLHERRSILLFSL